MDRAGPWTLPRIRRYLGWPQVSARTSYRRVQLVAIWRRPRLTARGDPDHDHVAAQIVARLAGLSRRAVVLAEDETHLNLLPHVRAGWTLRTARPKVPTPGTNQQVTVFGTLEVTTGEWAYRPGRRAAGFTALLDQLLRAFPVAPGDRRDLRQRQDPPRQMLDTAAPWTSPGCRPVTSRTSGMLL